MRRLALFSSRNQSKEAARTLPRRFHLRRIMMASALLFTGILGFEAYSQRAALQETLLTYSAEIGLQVDIIEVKNRIHTSDDALNAALKLQRGDPILAVDLRRIKSDLEQIGWVRKARIERHLPRKLIITLEERVPIGLYQQEKGHVLIDRVGAIIRDVDAAQFAHLPVVSGQDAASRAADILDILRTEPELFADIWAVQLISGRRWDVHLRSGIAIRLPERDPGMAWARLARIEQTSNITARDVSTIDLRIPDQLIVEPNIPVRGTGQKT